MLLRTHFKTCTPTKEVIEQIELLREGGHEYFERAELRPSDERWWDDILSKIVTEMREYLTHQSLSDDELLTLKGVKLPSHTTAKERAYKAEMLRKGGMWVFYAGTFYRDMTRILQEALLKGPTVIEARRALYGFAGAILVTLGCATLVEDHSLSDAEDTNN